MRASNQTSESAAPAVLPDTQTVLEQIGDCFLSVDADWRITYLNEAAAEVLSRVDLVGRHLWTEFPGAEESVFGQAYHQALDTQQPVFLEAVSPYSNRRFISRVYPCGAGLAIYLRNVTEIRAAQQQLEESKQWMQTLVDSCPCAVVLTRSGDGAFLYTNQCLRELLGLDSPEEALRHFASEFYGHPPDREVLRDAAAQLGGIFHWEGHFQRLDGTPFWSVGSFQRLVYKGERVVLSVYQDATEQRRLLKEAQEEADHDPLTGLLNHRAFYKQFDDLAGQAEAEGRPLAVVLLDLDNFKFFNDAYGHSVGDDVLRQAAACLRTVCRPNDVLARFGGDEFALLLPNTEHRSAEEVSAALFVSLDSISCRPPEYETEIPISLSLGAALLPGDAQTRQEAVQVADERLRQSKSGSVAGGEAQPLRAALRGEVQGFSMLDALVTAVDTKDRYTRRHSEDVLHYSLQIARALEMDEAALHAVSVSALLHDVGKIGVPDAILRKPGRLNEEEFEAVKLHPNIGAVIVAAALGLEETLDAVRHHHERWDGGGYPDGLRGAATPLPARLLAVADAYSAMTTDRPYRKGMTPDKALGILEEGAGTQWDPACVRAFMQSRLSQSGTAAHD